jgi:hypothetical protein
MITSYNPIIFIMIFWSNISQMGLSSAAEPAAAVVATSCSHSSSCTGVGDSGQSVSKPQGPTDGVETTARTSGTQNDTNKMICKTQQHPWFRKEVSQGNPLQLLDFAYLRAYRVSL